MDPNTKQSIENQIRTNHVMLYMKGTKNFPQCGFSGQVVQILNSYGVPYETCDVLSDPNIRQGLKEFSDWPTFPQLYVSGEFIGGCDIVTEMHENGELKEKLVAQS